MVISDCLSCSTRRNPALPDWVPYAILVVVLAAAILYLLWTAFIATA